MHQLCYKLKQNKKLIYLLGFIVIIFGLLPLPHIMKLSSFYLGIGLIYLVWLFDSIEWASTIPKMIIWLLVAPFLISLVIIAYVSLFWNDVVLNLPFALSFLLIFILVWLLAALRFDKKKIKVAMSFVNALTLTILALTFILYFGFDTASFIDSSITKEAEANGYNIESIPEILIKIVTLPYLLGGLWGTVAYEIRDSR